MEFEQNEIAAIYVNGAIVCTNCVKHEDRKLVSRDRIINREKTEKEDMIFFCDRCGEPI